MNKSKYHYRFNYPLKFDSEYAFPTKYYLNVQTGHSVIKNSQLKMLNGVIVSKDGDVVEIPEEEDEEEEGE